MGVPRHGCDLQGRSLSAHIPAERESGGHSPLPFLPPVLSCEVCLPPAHGEGEPPLQSMTVNLPRHRARWRVALGEQMSGSSKHTRTADSP